MSDGQLYFKGTSEITVPAIINGNMGDFNILYIRDGS